jgi:hypothetical protein
MCYSLAAVILLAVLVHVSLSCVFEHAEPKENSP